MNRTVALLSLGAVLVFAAAVGAQQPPSLDPERRPQQRAEMKKLAFLIGRFQGTARNGGTGGRRRGNAATVVYRENSWEAGGTFLSMRLRSTAIRPEPSVSLDVVGYDLQSRTFRATEFHPFSNGKPEVLTCTVEGQRLIIPSLHGHSRRVFQKSATGILVKTERKDGGRWVTVAESAFTRLP